ncbi:hypothetical protein RvY_14737 [Ramazzottius varieornatus]|uniref:Uncharacterized protein n=1 Tax=Ramazzottius varieornatus TaxID=947166 RepID=A0A1D1VSD6_RAMVA|nr:hypothetical protein RvY_14737 [Ramazzottius varieornatus]
MAKEPQSPTEIDAVILAELPDDKKLRTLVQKHMLHRHYPLRCHRSETESNNAMSLQVPKTN